MTGKGTRPRQVRGVTDQSWEDFNSATKKQGTDRSKAIRDFIAWYTGKTDRLPQRPTG